MKIQDVMNKYPVTVGKDAPISDVADLLVKYNLTAVSVVDEEKVDMGNAKVDIENEKVDIESVLSEKGSNFSVKTTVHIHRLFCECYPNSWPQEMREV